MDQPSQQVLHSATNAVSSSSMFPLPVSNAASLMPPPVPAAILPSTDAVNMESTSSPSMKAATSSPHVSPMLQTLATPVTNGQDLLFPIGATKTKIRTTTKAQAGMNGGRWTEQEHQSFLAGLRLYGREWKKVASKIKTRTSAQIRSHAQKYFAKLARDEEARKQSHLLQTLQQDGAASSAFGYVSDGSSSSATSINITAELATAETDPTTSSTMIPTPAPMQPPSQPATTRIVLPVKALSTITPAPAAGAKTYKAIRPAISFVSKKRSRSLTLEAPISSPSLMTKRPKTAGDERAVSEPERLPSPEELVAKVSPNVRQRLASLIDAEVSALQVLSCIWWMQEQDSVPQKSPLATQCTHMSMGNATSTLAFAPSAQVNLAMPTTDSAPSIY